MKQVPSTWDDIRFIDGYPGKYVVLARRKGQRWYVAGVNAQPEPLKVKVKLPMFAPGEEVVRYSDDKELKGKMETVRLNKNQEISLSVPTNGGVVIVSGS